MVAEANAKSKTEVTTVKMEDGRSVDFPGKRKVSKEYLIDESKIETDGTVLQIGSGAIRVRFDLINGSTRTFTLPLGLLAQFAGHGGSQKYGDELASPADKPLSPDDMVLALEDLDVQIQAGDWRAKSEGGGVSGASVVVLALMEASKKSREEVKAFLQGKLDRAKAAGEKLSRQELYASFKNPASKVGAIIQRMEQEKLSKGTKVDADAELAELAG